MNIEDALKQAYEDGYHDGSQRYQWLSVFAPEKPREGEQILVAKRWDKKPRLGYYLNGEFHEDEPTLGRIEYWTHRIEMPDYR